MQCINAGVEIGFNCRIPFMDELLLPCRAYSLQSTGSSDSDEVMRSPNGTMLQSTYYVTDRKMAADNKFVTFGKSSIQYIPLYAVEVVWIADTHVVTEVIAVPCVKLCVWVFLCSWPKEKIRRKCHRLQYEADLLDLVF